MKNFSVEEGGKDVRSFHIPKSFFFFFFLQEIVFSSQVNQSVAIASLFILDAVWFYYSSPVQFFS